MGDGPEQSEHKPVDSMSDEELAGVLQAAGLSRPSLAVQTIRNAPAPQTAQSTSGEHTELRNVQTTFLKARSWSMRAWIGQRCCRTSHCGGACQSLLPPAWAAAGSRSHSRRSACYTTTSQRTFGFGNRSVNTSRQVPRDLVWCVPLISALAIRLGAFYMCNLPSSGMYLSLIHI